MFEYLSFFHDYFCEFRLLGNLIVLSGMRLRGAGGNQESGKTILVIYI